MDKQLEFYQAIEDNNVKAVALLLKDQNVYPFANANSAIGYASYDGYLDIVELLLNDSRVNASDDCNYAIKSAYRNKEYEVVNLLLKNTAIQNTLKKYDLDFYNTLITLKIKNKVNKF
jgi:hypothetical protein